GSLPPTRRVRSDDVARMTPGVRGGAGGVVFWDGQLTDDARLVVALARTAAAYGARVVAGAEVLAVDGADVHVRVDDADLRLRAGVVVNAAGVWSQQLAPGIRLVPSRGSHLVLPADRLGSPLAALTVPLPGSRSRYVFALPQPDGLVHLGLTDEPVDGPVPAEDAQPSDAEVQQLLATVNQVLAEPLTREDLVGAYAGYRPLVLPESAGAGPGGATADLSRKHLLRWDGPVLSVVGGKLTTYRAMAEETVDAVVARLGRGAARTTTARLPLVGAAPRVALDRVVAAERLVARYGTEAPLVEALGPALVVAGRPETVGELRFAVRHEGARSVSDLLDRRTRIGLVPADRERAVAVAEQVLPEG
ncbi:glycerol-3-phosphate dehydrogenase/oxidase, partial [Blastococcus atacamensis]|uniref:glycerol-3-phosphate dehydrogenase/oxidase n=1 Tax=Blastococcus atacamensis TaxID=2070508 RepID=UPI000CEC49E6